MPRNKEFDSTLAIRAARDVFWERGYSATSLAQLEAATGLSRSSLYGSFLSKRDLFDRAVESYIADVVDPTLGRLETGNSGRDELIQHFLRMSQFFRNAPRRLATRGCLLLNTAMELSALDQAAANEVRAYRSRVRAAFLSPLVRMSVEDPQAKADLLTAGQFGLTLTSRLDAAQASSLAVTLADQVSAW